MGLLNIKEIFDKDGDEVDTEVEDQFYDKSREEFHMENGMAGADMKILEPRAFSESQQIADYLKARSSIIVNLKRVTPDQAKRIVDFLYGTIYAIGGSMQKIGGGIFLCAPNNFNVEGSISEEAPSGKEKKSSKKSEDDDEDFF